MFFFNHYFYWVTILLQVICVIHVLRTGKQVTWIWLIIFLPLIGSLVYIFTQVFNARDLQNVQSRLGNFLMPEASMSRLERNLQFSDTFNNRIALADACLKAGQTPKAIKLYEESLTGNFAENEFVLSQLILAYFQVKQYADILPVARKIYKLPQFARSPQHICYALALSHTGDPVAAEKEFQFMKTRFSNYEARYEFARFLIQQKREQEAVQLLKELVGESAHLSARERRYNSKWFARCREELRKLA